MFSKPLKILVFRFCIKFLRVFAVSKVSKGSVKIDDGFNIACNQKLTSTKPIYDPIWWFRF